MNNSQENYVLIRRVNEFEARFTPFIDTNVLLNFYAFSNDDLAQLEKLVNIIKTKVVKLYVTQQVVDEFYRNRDSKLSVSFDSFKPMGNVTCPRFMTSLPEYSAYQSALNAYTESRKVLAEKARGQADARELLADQLFKRIIEQVEVIPIDEQAYSAADKRNRLGNPPGKSNTTIGDEVNWELLLAKVPKNADLHVITKDSDYGSKLNPGSPKVFLQDEWQEKKSGKLLLYEQISLFFKAMYPGEAFSLEIEKQASIDALVNSGTFAMTHAAITQLSPYIDFLTEEQAEEIVQGALSNSQVAWIASDSDVEDSLQKMLEVHGKALSATQRKRLEEALGMDTEEALVMQTNAPPVEVVS